MSNTTTHDVMVAQTEKAGELLNYFQDHRNRLAADIAQRNAAYDRLTANLKGVVNGQMHFTAIIDPDEAAPTNKDGGTFLNIKDALSVAPAGSYVVLALMAGKTHDLTSSVTSYADILITATGEGAKPILRPVAYANETYNYCPGIFMRGGGGFYAFGIEIKLPTAKSNAALGWAVTGVSLIGYFNGGHTRAGFDGCVVSGGETLGLTSARTGGLVNVSLYNTSLTGAIFAVKSATLGVCTVAKSSVTLANGAALTDGGTVGTNILQN